jgi:outer membrane protein TolC
MRSKYLLLIVFLFFGQILINAQTKVTTCELTNLYQLTLSKSPTLERQKIKNRMAKVDKQSASSRFDYQIFSDLSINRSGLNLFNADPRTDFVDGQIKTNNLSLSGGVQRIFRTGLTASVGIQYARIGDNLPFNSFNENVGAFISNNQTSTSLSLTQPLLKGRGKYITTANEKVANISIESQQYNTTFIASNEVYSMTLGYWQYLAATKSLEIYQGNEERVSKVLEITNELVKAEKKPMADLLQIQADLKGKERQTINAQQAVYSARQNLGRQIGFTTVESEGISLPENDFPNIDKIGTDLSLQDFLDVAYQNRNDLKAINKSLEILGIYLDVANNNIKPQLDLTGTVNYGGTDEGNGVDRFFSALGQQQGRNYQVGVGLKYLFPINNNAAEANQLNNQLQYNDQEILLKNQIRNIELNVSIAYNNFLNSIEAVKKSEQALIYHEEVFENEQFKFQNGLTTLLNLILFQERLTFAQLDFIQNQQQFAVAISNLRYETGTIFSEKQNGNTVNLDLFYSLPRK